MIINSKIQQVVTYKTNNGDILKGLLLCDKIQHSVNNTQFIHVGNFANRVLLDNIISIKDTNKAWGDYGY